MEVFLKIAQHVTLLNDSLEESLSLHAQVNIVVEDLNNRIEIVSADNKEVGEITSEDELIFKYISEETLKKLLWLILPVAGLAVILIVLIIIDLLVGGFGWLYNFAFDLLQH